MVSITVVIDYETSKKGEKKDRWREGENLYPQEHSESSFGDVYSVRHDSAVNYLPSCPIITLRIKPQNGISIARLLMHIFAFRLPHFFKLSLTCNCLFLPPPIFHPHNNFLCHVMSLDVAGICPLCLCQVCAYH